jgi:tetratricopeptide (TPR) repeat protein
VAASPSADAWVLRAENLAHLIQTSGWAFAMSNGLDVERFARNALELDRRNAAAQYLIAARWVFAPRPFNNFRRGVEMMEAIFSEGDMGRDDHFNVASAIGWAHVQQRNFGDAVPWLERALAVYPTNRFAADLLAEAESGGSRRRRQ